MQPGRTNGERQSSAADDGLSHPLELPEIIFTAIFIPIAAFSWVGILLAELGAFNGWRVFVYGASLSAILLAGAFHELRASRLIVATVSAGRSLLLLLVVSVAAMVFSRPGEYLIEGADASVYLASGRQIQRTGAISSTDPLLELMPANLRPSFFMAGPTTRRESARLPGGLSIGGDGRVHPSFFHLLPVWVAIATAAIGPYGGYFVNVLLGVLGVFAVALIGRRLWSPAAGLVAAALLTLNFGQILHARLPSSEMLAQFMALSAVFFTLLAWDRRTRFAGACAGAAVGLAAFTRVDAMILIVIPAVAWLLLARRGRSIGKAWSWYATVLGLVSAHAVLHATTVAHYYVERLFGTGVPRLLRILTHLGATTAIGVIVTVIVGTILIIKYRKRTLIWLGIGAALAVAAMPTPMIGMLNKLISPAGLIAGVAGLALVFTTRWDPRVLTLVVPLLVQTALLMAWSVTIVLPSEFRRAVPVMLPAVTLLIGFLVAEAGRRSPWLARAIWLLPIGLAASFVRDAAPLVREPLMQGVEAQVAAIASHISPNALVLLDRTVPGHLPLALQYGYDRSSVRMSERPAEGGEIAPLITAALASGRPVFVVVAPFVDFEPQRLWRSDFADFDIQREAILPLHYKVLVPVVNRFPRTFRTDEIPVAVYRVSARDRDVSTPVPFVIDVGGDDFSALVDGFHAAEQLPSTRARWTSGESRIAVPRLSRTSAGTMTLVLRVSAYRPPGQGPALIQIAVDGLPAGTISNPTGELREYRLPLSDAVQARLVAGPTMMSITSDSFIPKAVGLNDDQRRLGIVLDWIRIE